MLSEAVEQAAKDFVKSLAQKVAEEHLEDAREARSGTGLSEASLGETNVREAGSANAESLCETSEPGRLGKRA